MDKLTTTKITVTALLGILAAKVTALAVPMTILVILNILDYFTGLTAAPWRGEERSSRKGFRGIAKKICMWVLVVLGVAVDFLLEYTAQSVGITLPMGFLMGAMVIVWLICNEIISILENIGDIGAPVPGFLRKAIEWVKRATEEKADITKDGD